MWYNLHQLSETEHFFFIIISCFLQLLYKKISCEFNNGLQSVKLTEIRILLYSQWGKVNRFLQTYLNNNEFLSRKQQFNYWKNPEKTARYDRIINELCHFYKVSLIKPGLMFHKYHLLNQLQVFMRYKKLPKWALIFL